MKYVYIYINSVKRYIHPTLEYASSTEYLNSDS